MIRAALARAALVWFVTSAAALAGDPPQAPFLRIEAGGHTGAVPHLASDRAGDILVSGGYDKTVRVWALPAGRQIEVLRPPIGPGREGEIYAVAVTPDGSRIFAAGATGGSWDGTFSIYVFDTAKSALAGRLAGLPSPVDALAVSPDGTRLAAGLAQGGLYVWDAATGRLLSSDPTYGGPVRAIAFDSGNGIFSSCEDGRLRAYTPDGRLAVSSSLAGFAHPWGIALSPDESLLAVTNAASDGDGHLHLGVLSARTLAPVFEPNTAGLHGEGLLSVAWASGQRGSTQLLAGGYARDGNSYVIRRWSDFGLGPATDIAAAGDTILHILPLPAGGAAYSTEDPGWGLLAPDGAVSRRPTPPMADLRPARDRLAISADGQTIAFKTGSATFRFDAAAESLAPETAPDAALSVAREAALGLSLTDWRDSSAPRLNGARLALDRTEYARSAAILPDNRRVLLGTDTHLRLFDRDGRAVAAIPIPAAAWAIAASADGTVAVAALLDGTLRWYDLTPSALLSERAALFADPAGRRWVLFTPEGFFDDGAQGGNELVGLLLNRARNQQPLWLSFSQAYRTLYAPEVVHARIRGDAAPAHARLASLGDLRLRMAQQPAAKILSACLPVGDGPCATVRPDAALAPGQKLRVRIAVQDRGAGVGPIDAFVNGRNTGRLPAPALVASRAIVELELPLDPDRNVVQLRVYDTQTTIFSETEKLMLGGAAPDKSAHALYVLAVGIDHFAEPTLSLHYAVADADSFVDLVRQAAAPLFASVHVTKLTDVAATRAGILNALAGLATQVRADDTFIFYVASHGVRSQGTGRFLLVPQDIGSVASWDAIEAASIDETTLIAALARIEARDALLLLDTCYSGEVTADNLANIGHETGRYLLAAARSDQEALDSYDSRNGVLIYALREALHGRAAHDDSGTISALSLGEYISRRVGQLAREKGGDQDAVFRSAQRDLASFPVARVTQ